MAYLLYYLVLLPLSFLPLPVLHVLGRLFSWLNWHLIGYRKTIVVDNLRGAFPDRDEAEIARLARGFYHFFFDSISESIKQFSISERAAVRRCKVMNPEILDHLKDKSVIAVGGHYANWEMAALSFISQFPHHGVMGIYSPLKNEALDRLFAKNRSRTGTRVVSRRVVDEYFEASDEGAPPMVDFFVADQAPSNIVWQKLLWTRFLHQITPFLAGPERYAVRYDRPVYYVTLRRVARGYYEARLLPITDTPREEEPGFISERFARILEEEIERDPLPWLWSHRRWKREVPEAVAELLRERPFIPPEYSPERPDRRR